MKIDLHLHTKKIAQGDNIKRNIEPDDFKKKLMDSNVGIAAITNHYFFDKEQYEAMIDNDNYMLLPGVELDVKFDGDKVQANVICPPSQVDELIIILKEIKNDKSPIEYFEFIKQFNKEYWIIYLDYKNSNNTAWKSSQMASAIKDMDKAFVLVDTNKATTRMILNANNFNCLIGSDVENWDDYPIISKKLLDTKLHINNYHNFWKILKTSYEATNELFKNIKKNTFKNMKMPDTTFSISEINIMQGVNIIFGAKKTGKTKILEWLREQTPHENSYYSSSEKEKNIEGIQKELLDTNYFTESKFYFQKNIEVILNYTETKFVKFNSYTNSLLGNKKMYFHDKLTTTSIDPLTNVKTQEDIKNIELISKSLKSTYIGLNKIDIEIANWLKETNKIMEILWNKYKKIYKDSWKAAINLEIKKNIDTLNGERSGVTAKPSDIGLVKRYEEKQKFWQTINFLKIHDTEQEREIKTFEIPGRDNVAATQKCLFIDVFSGKKLNRDKFKNKLKADDIRNSIKKLEFKSDFLLAKNTLVEYSTNSEEYFTECVVIQDKFGNSNFSNGEKAHLLLHNVLSQGKDYILLDEPGVFLGRESITEFLIPKISELKQQGKKIVITTHNSSLGINTIPVNYIYRKYQNGNDECQTYTGSIWTSEFKNSNKKDLDLKFSDEIIGTFEGGKEHFNFRKEIYEN